MDKLGRDAQVKGENIDLTAKNGNLGTLNKPLLVDTADGGVLSAIADNGTVVITEISDDMTIGTVSSTGAGSGVTLTTLDGSILESDKTENDSIKKLSMQLLQQRRRRPKRMPLQISTRY